MAIHDITARLLADQAERAAALNRPVVTLSYAQSIDGSLAGRSGGALFLSGDESKRMTHHLRAAHMGILVGIGTVLADDPRLTARLAGGPDPQPVVLDRMLRIPRESRLLARADTMPWILCGPQASGARRAELERSGAMVVVVEVGDDGLLCLGQALERVFHLGLNSLMVEGGAKVITSFLDQRLVDQAVVTIAPAWIGGLPVVDAPLGKGNRYPRLLLPVMEVFGGDWVVWGKIGEGRYETAEPVFPGAASG